MSTLHTTYGTLHTAHCTLHTAHCILHTAHRTLHTAHCTLHTAHCTLHAAHSTHCRSTLWTLYNVHCKFHTADCTVHTVKLTIQAQPRGAPVIGGQLIPLPARLALPLLVSYPNFNMSVKSLGLALPYGAPPPIHPPPWSHQALALQGPATRVALESLGRRSVRSCPEEGAVIVY